MGKSKSAAPVVKKESKFKIPVVFDCPKCRNKQCVRVVLKRQLGTGFILCKGGCKPTVTEEDNGGSRSSSKRTPYIFSADMLKLEEPVDVFFKFYEACREMRQMELGTTTHSYADLDVFGGSGGAEQDAAERRQREFNEAMLYGDGGDELMMEHDSDTHSADFERGGGRDEEAFDYE